jgi:hypothetical protein
MVQLLEVDSLYTSSAYICSVLTKSVYFVLLERITAHSICESPPYSLTFVFHLVS